MQNGNFVGVLEGTCEFRLGHEADLPALDRHLLESVSSAQKVHEGPIEDTYEGLPGVRYDITTNYPGSGNVTIRQNLHVATDTTTRVVYETDSTSVQATGFASFLRKLDVEFQVSKTGQPAAAGFKMRVAIQVAKPWYAPSGIFFSEAQKSAITQYNKSRDEAVPDLLSHL
jgi:hypothetical protein